MTVKDIMKITLNLVVIYIIGGIILSVVHALTSPIRYQNKIVKKAEDLQAVGGGAKEGPRSLQRAGKSVRGSP